MGAAKQPSTRASARALGGVVRATKAAVPSKHEAAPAKEAAKTKAVVMDSAKTKATHEPRPQAKAEAAEARENAQTSHKAAPRTAHASTPQLHLRSGEVNAH